MSAEDEMTCQELVELVTDYLEDALPPATRAAFETHLAVCGGCRAYLDQLRRTIALTGTLAPADISPDIERDLLAAFRDWKRANA